MYRVICDNYYCVFWRENHCTSEDIELDRTGTCIVFRHVPVNPSTIERNRAKYLEGWNRDAEEALRLDIELMRERELKERELNRDKEK